MRPSIRLFLIRPISKFVLRFRIAKSQHHFTAYFPTRFIIIVLAGCPRSLYAIFTVIDALNLVEIGFTTLRFRERRFLKTKNFLFAKAFFADVP